jgi:predicted Zn-dependent protease
VLLRHYVWLAVERSDWPEALRRAETFVARLPRSPQAWLSRIDALRRAGQEEESLTLLRKMVRRHSRNAEVLLAWAHEALRRRDWAEAARRFSRLRRRFPAREEGYREAANALFEDGRLDEAEALVAEGMQRTGNPLMWYTAAELAERADDREEAVRRWEAMRIRFPSVASGFLRGAEALARAGRGEAAAALISQARDFFPGNQEVATAAARLVPSADAAPSTEP